MAEYVNESTSSIPFPTSKYLSDSSVFYRDGKAPLLVLVEDEDDRNFWNKMFACLANDYLSIDIHTLKSISAMATAQSNAAGKILDATGKDPLMKVEDWIIVTSDEFAASDSFIYNWLEKGSEKYGTLLTAHITDDAMVAVYSNGCQYSGKVPKDLKKALEETDLKVYRVKITENYWFFADEEGHFRCNF